MALPKGRTNNPGGRPPKSRALTEALAAAGARPITVNGKEVVPNQIVGEILWQMAATARGELPSGLALHLEPKEWLEVVKFLYAQIDGPPKDGPSGDKDDPFHFKLYEGIDPDQL